MYADLLTKYSRSDFKPQVVRRGPVASGAAAAAAPADISG